MIYQSTIYYYLRGRKLYCRVNCNNKSRTRSIGQSVQEKYWNQNRQRVKRSHPQSVEINNNLSALEAEIRHAEGTLTNRGQTATPERIFAILDGTEEDTTILKLFTEHNRKVKQRVGNDYVKATYTKFKTIKYQVSKAIKDITGNDDMNANDFDLQFIEDLETLKLRPALYVIPINK